LSEHLADLFHGEFVDLTADGGVGEADRAAKIAAIGDIDDDHHGSAEMFFAEAAVTRTVFRAARDGLMDSGFGGLFQAIHFFEESDVAADNFGIFAMFFAVFFHPDLALAFEEGGRQRRETFGTDAERCLRQSVIGLFAGLVGNDSIF
jgi:hypothetical protein